MGALYDRAREFWLRMSGASDLLRRQEEHYSRIIEDLRSQNESLGSKLESFARDYPNLQRLYNQILETRDPTTIQMQQGQINSLRTEVGGYRRQIAGFEEARRGYQQITEGLQRVIAESSGLIGHLKLSLRKRAEDRFGECRALARTIDKNLVSVVIISPEDSFLWVGENASKELGYTEEQLRGRKYYEIIKLKEENRVFNRDEVRAFFNNPRKQAGIVTVVRPNGEEVDTYIIKRPLFYREERRIGGTETGKGQHEFTFVLFYTRDSLEKRKQPFEEFGNARRIEEEGRRREQTEQIRRMIDEAHAAVDKGIPPKT